MISHCWVALTFVSKRVFVHSFHIEILGFSCTLSCKSNIFPHDMTHFETLSKRLLRNGLLWYTNDLYNLCTKFSASTCNFNSLQASSVSNTSRYVNNKLNGYQHGSKCHTLIKDFIRPVCTCILVILCDNHLHIHLHLGI